MLCSTSYFWNLTSSLTKTWLASQLGSGPRAFTLGLGIMASRFCAGACFREITKLVIRDNVAWHLALLVNNLHYYVQRLGLILLCE